MNVRILKEANEDLFDGFRFYDSQEKGMGDYFFDSLFSDIDSLQFYAGIHPMFLGFHRMLSERFPYAIYYRVEGDIAWVHAVLDCRQNPAKTAERLAREDKSGGSEDEA